MISQILSLGSTIIDKLFETPSEKKKAQTKLIEMQVNGELAKLEHELSVLLAEAKSKDPWTSRARPSFLYVIYIFMLSAIPMGFLYSFYPGVASNISNGVSEWLQAIPNEMWTLFGIGYLGYTGARSFDKRLINKK